MEFKISSALKDIIGRELITNDLVAIFELVKNAYDANAKKVNIKFKDIKSKTKNSKILILDDGDGMSKEDIINKWLFVGYSEKKLTEKQLEDFRSKINSKRIFAGAKGIGRFSCDRLGSKLIIYTKKKSDPKFNVLKVYWNKFEEDQNKEFQNIKVDFEQTNNIPYSDLKDQGTLLEITNLSEEWPKDKLVSLKRYLQRLINPNQVSPKDIFKVHLEAKEFLTEDQKEKRKEESNSSRDLFIINGEIKNIVFEKLNIKTTFIEVNVSESGKIINTRLEDKGSFIFSYKEKNQFSNLKDVSVKLSFLNPIAKKTFTEYMGLQPRNYGSLFLFKNGFRILPYGEPGNDWMELDFRKAQGYARFLGTRDIIGRIEINGWQPNFREVTSRSEGLVNTESVRELKKFFMEKVLRILEKYVVEAIEWDSKTDSELKKSEEEIKKDILSVVEKLTGKSNKTEVNYNKDLLDIVEEKKIEKIEQNIKNLKEAIEKEKDKEKKSFLSKTLTELNKGINLEKEKFVEERKKIELEKEKIEYEILFYKDKNPGGIDSKNIQHIVGISTFKINSTINTIVSEINSLSKEEIIKEIEKIKLENDKIRVMANIISRANFNLQSKYIKANLNDYVNSYLNSISKITEGNIEIKFKETKQSNKFKITFKPIDIAIIIDNLISNAKKAGATKILFTIENKKDKTILTVLDNGSGINSKIKDEIFNLGFSTTKNGSGIGLYHIKELLNKSGQINFIGNHIEEEYSGAAFEIIINGKL